MSEARRLVLDYLRARLANNKSTVYRNDLFGVVQAAGMADQFAAVLLDLERDNALVPMPDPPRSGFARLIVTNGPGEFRVGPGALAAGPPPPPPPGGRKTKGKHIDARMWTRLTEEPAALDWSVRRWAEALGCTHTTILGTNTHKVRIPELRARMMAAALERAEKVPTGCGGGRRKKLHRSEAG